MTTAAPHIFGALPLKLNLLAWKVFVFPIKPPKGADVDVPPVEATTTGQP